MRDRAYMLLFAILPKKWQSKLWNRLANKFGYHGLTKFGNETIHMSGSKSTRDDFYDWLKANATRQNTLGR